LMKHTEKEASEEIYNFIMKDFEIWKN
jgi:hypothetical protein